MENELEQSVLAEAFKKTCAHYNFTKDEFQKFSKQSGIYALMYHNEIIYIGQSNNIGRRLREHSSETAIQKTINEIYKKDGKCNLDKKLAKYIFIERYREEIEFIVLKETDDLDIWEKYFISLYQPKYNYIGVDVPYNSYHVES